MRRVFLSHSIGAIKGGKFQRRKLHHESPLKMPNSNVRTQRSGEDSEDDVPTEDRIGMSNGGETALAMPSTRRRSKKERTAIGRD